MPSIAQIDAFSTLSSFSPGLKKRKRVQWPFDDAEQCAKLGGVPYAAPLTGSYPVPNPDNLNSVTPSLSTVFHIAFPNHPQKLVLKPRATKMTKSHECKRQRKALADAHQQDEIEGSSNFQFFTSQYTSLSEKPADPELATIHSSAERSGQMDLSPCHICHQKPRVKKDLDAYGYCDECERRTCYVCMRNCLGAYLEAASETYSEGCKKIHSDTTFTNQGISVADQRDTSEAERNLTQAEREKLDGLGLHRAFRTGEWKTRCQDHRERVCSHCCVERGTDGEVWCLGCLRIEGQLRFAPK